MKNISEYLMIFLTIISCNTVYMNFIGSNLSIIIILIYCINLVFGIFINGIKKNVFVKFIVFMCVYYAFLIIFYMLNNIGSNLFEFICYFAVILPLIVLYFINIDYENIKKILIKFKNTIIVISIISIIFYVLTNLNLLNNYKYVLVKWSLTESIPSLFNIYFLPQTKIRNAMFFAEPAMYSIFLVLALAIERMDGNKLINRFILAVTILTTKSATGIILGIIILIYDLIKIKKKGIIIVICPLIIVFGIVFAYNVFDQKTLSLSYQTRVDDYSACIKTWKEYPIFGSGFMNSEVIQSNMSYFRRSNLGLSNSLFVILAQGGIYFASLYLIPIIYMLRKKRKTKEFLVILMFLILLLTTIFHYTILTYTGLALGIALILKNLSKKSF